MGCDIVYDNKFIRSSTAQSFLLYLNSSSFAFGARFLVAGGSWGLHGFAEVRELSRHGLEI